MARSRAAYEYTEAEDKSMRLGFLLIAAGLLSLLGLGCCWLRPALQERGGGGSANCTVLAVKCWPVRELCKSFCGSAAARLPVERVAVAEVCQECPSCLSCRTSLNCSYIPPCARDDQENSENVTYKQKYWKEKVGSQPFTCYFNQHLRPDDVMLKRTHDETVLLHCFLWPVVTFLVGVLIVVLTICAKSLAVRAEAIKKKKHL
ncbi:KCMB4 protein, partial [Regulus satrapa]|nr:KCMB4 protein [Regulus satrapa]